MMTHSNRQDTAGASRTSLTALPADALAAITAHLSPANCTALALTHPAFTAALRPMRTSCTAHIAEEAQLAELSATLSTHYPALVKLAVHWSCETTPKLQTLVLPDTIRRLRLAFVTRQPSGVRFGAPSARGVTALSLSGFNDPGRRLNNGSQPWLSALKDLGALQALTLLCLQSDAGLQDVTQLRSLHIAFPNHVDADTPETLCCPECGELHAEDVVEFLREIMQQESAVVGPHIAALPLLTSLTLDCASDADLPGLQGYNALRNRFEWLEKHKTAAPIFPALEKIDVLNLPPFRAMPFSQLEAVPAADDEVNALRSFCFETGHNMRSPLCIAGIFAAVPSLTDYRVEYLRRQPGGVLPPPQHIAKQRDFESHFVYLENGSMLCHFARMSGGRGAAAAAAPRGLDRPVEE